MMMDLSMQKQKCMRQIEDVAIRLCQKGKGMLYLADSDEMMSSSFSMMSIESTGDNRKIFKDMIITAPGLEQYVSGIVMTPETVMGLTSTGVKVPQYLESKGILSGVLLDSGFCVFPSMKDEVTTLGFDTLQKSCMQFQQIGCKFAKWRSMLKCGDGLPSSVTLLDNCMSMCKFVMICQEVGLLPVLSLEIMCDSNQTIEQNTNSSRRVLSSLMNFLNECNISLKSVIIMTTLITPGPQSIQISQVTPKDIVQTTLKVITGTLPPQLPGIFLMPCSCCEDKSLSCMSEMMKSAQTLPYYISFAFGKSLTMIPMKQWAGQKINLQSAQKTFIEICQTVKLALTTGQQ